MPGPSGTGVGGYIKTTQSSGGITHDVQCPTFPNGQSMIVLGGGYEQGGSAQVQASSPNGNGWRVITVTSTTINVSVLCAGAPGAPTLTGYEVTTATAHGTASATAVCSAGKVVIGGGASIDNQAPLMQSFPFGNGWRANSNNTSTNTTAYAICAAGS